MYWVGFVSGLLTGVVLTLLALFILVWAGARIAIAIRKERDLHSNRDSNVDGRALRGGTNRTASEAEPGTH